mmetsp:Transcript_30191/g.75448  ORF Transcript_30191/g.75448 Transcript_30191/m.75448 type:complete len:82 (-) Transcript_30191:1225-1470(-)
MSATHVAQARKSKEYPRKREVSADCHGRRERDGHDPTYDNLLQSPHINVHIRHAADLLGQSDAKDSSDKAMRSGNWETKYR